MRTYFGINDPARVSHFPVRQPVRRPGGVGGFSPPFFPGVVGATPLRHSGYEKRTSPRCLICQTATSTEDLPNHVAPRQGCPLRSHRSRGAAPKTRGSAITSDPTTPPGCRTDCLTGKCDTMAGSFTLNGSSFPAVFGTSCLDTQAKKR